jgi:hypothetical protein
MKKVPLKGGDEFDALTKARKFYSFKRGVLKKIKRGYNKRFRQSSRKECEDS